VSIDLGWWEGEEKKPMTKSYKEKGKSLNRVKKELFSQPLTDQFERRKKRGREKVFPA